MYTKPRSDSHTRLDSHLSDRGLFVFSGSALMGSQNETCLALSGHRFTVGIVFLVSAIATVTHGLFVDLASMMGHSQWDQVGRKSSL